MLIFVMNDSIATRHNTRTHTQKSRARKRAKDLFVRFTKLKYISRMCVFHTRYTNRYSQWEQSKALSTVRTRIFPAVRALNFYFHDFICLLLLLFLFYMLFVLNSSDFLAVVERLCFIRCFSLPSTDPYRTRKKYIPDFVW